MANRKLQIFRLDNPHALNAALAIAAAYLIAGQWPEVRYHPLSLLTSLRASIFSVLLAWVAVAVILLGVYFISSSEETRLLLRASLLASVPAMWLVPAMLLIKVSSPLSISLGLLLIANSVRVLIARSLARRDYLPPLRKQPRLRLFSYSRISTASNRETAIVVLGALAIQMGIAAISGGYEVTSAVLIGTGAMIWTLAAISRGVFQPRKSMDSFARAGLTLILAILISASQMPSDAQAGSDPKPASPARKNVTHVFTEAPEIPPASHRMVEGVEGVILRPEIVRPRLTFSVAKPRHPSRSSPSGFRFTGEYQLFPLSSRDLKKDWSIETGTPIDSVYATLSGRPLQTEAYQKLDPPLDFTRVHKLQLTLVSHEGAPAAATVQLIGNRKLPDLGPEIFGLDKTPEETIEFAVPDSLRDSQVTGIRIVFRCIAAQCSQSMRVAVQGFRLIVS